MHQLRKPTSKQIYFARLIGLDPENKSFRVLSAEIEDRLEFNSFEEVSKKDLRPGLTVLYTGKRGDMPKDLIISTIGKNGFIYFKKTRKRCRPWDISV